MSRPIETIWKECEAAKKAWQEAGAEYGKLRTEYTEALNKLPKEI